ncbi:hypothetical protein AJ80_07300 [Polytolypa hystricis UAMH7299]|uniref:Uncharacterized protein n=1 Tax=Polytolypa hystricis (strain UAMH7299) TaxID=1447883 RepID=A0A2B7XH16_POLH7|nr:hypothetical protein AJ80_07300 [Polytolypa hystricis UAMH7299]
MQSSESPALENSEYTDERAKMQARREFLAHLPPDTHEYRYHGFSLLKEATNKEYNQFLEHDDSSGSPYIIFTNISPEEVTHNEDFPGRVDYSPPLQILILTMVSLPHEEGARLFDQIVGDKAVEMKVRRLLSFRGATRSKTPDRNKQADSSYGPRQLPPGRSPEWPTVAVEVGFSEMREKLKSDAAYWLNRSSGDVLTVITIDIKRSGNICIILWKRPVVTNQYPNPEPEAIQEIKIYRGKGGQAANLRGDELRIPFRHMMLRDPGPGEEDFVITRDELLHDLADAIWWGIDHK